MKKILSFVGASLVLAGAMFVTSCQDPKEYELSDIKTDTIQGLGTPSNLAVTQSYGSVVLTWDVVANAAGYSVVRFDTSDSSDKKGTVVNAAGGNARASTTNIVSDGKKGTVYIIDSSKELENGKKYRYEVSALATTAQNYDTSVARTLYFKDGGVASKTITAELPDTVDVASAVASGVSFAFDKDNKAVITLPTAAGLDYRYRIIETTSITRGETNGNYVAMATTPLTTTFTNKYTEIDSNGTSILSNTRYQLYLEVRAKNTNKYGGEYTIVNTGLTAESYETTGNTSLTAHNIVPAGKSKFMLIARTNLATNDAPTNYTFKLKSYKLYAENGNILVSKTATVNETLTMAAVDGTTTTWGAEYTTAEITAGDAYLFVFERTRNSDGKINRSAVTVTGIDPTAATTYETNLNFSYLTTTAWTLDSAGTNYTSDIRFYYNIGSNYTIGKIYKAKGGTYTTSATTTNGLSSAFEEVTVTTNKTTDTDTTHEYGTKSYTTSVTKAAYDASTTGTQNYYYVLLVTEKSTNKTLVLSTTGLEYKLN